MQPIRWLVGMALAMGWLMFDAAAAEKKKTPQAATAVAAPAKPVKSDAELAQEKLAEDWVAKLGGAWYLHEQTRGRPLDFFVMFSSVAALFGSAGQGSYSAANAFLDGLAHERRRLDLPALSINWGPWGGAGMASERSGADEGI